MKAFHFRLEQVLHFFRQQELLQSMTVADVERRMREKQRQREEHLGQKDTIETYIRSQHQSLTREELTGSYAHAEYLARMIGLLEGDILVVREQLDQERALLLNLTKRRRVVEELRTRKRASYDEHFERLEFASLDEVNSRRIPALNIQKESKI